MKLLHSHESDGARIELHESDGALSLYVVEVTGRDATAPVSSLVLGELAAAAVQPVALPDGKWSPAAYAAIEQMRAALQAIDEHKDPHEQFAIREWVRAHVGRRAP